VALYFGTLALYSGRLLGPAVIRVIRVIRGPSSGTLLGPAGIRLGCRLGGRRARSGWRWSCALACALVCACFARGGGVSGSAQARPLPAPSVFFVSFVSFVVECFVSGSAPANPFRAEPPTAPTRLFRTAGLRTTAYAQVELRRDFRHITAARKIGTQAGSARAGARPSLGGPGRHIRPDRR
jgi:hypothetical protein